MNKRRWWVTRRTFDDRHQLDNLGRAVVRWFTLRLSKARAQEIIDKLHREIALQDRRREEIRRELAVLRGKTAALRADRAARVPTLCEWLMCLVVDPEFQEDRLADYWERFDNLWVPKFGQRAAVVVYLWHVLRQSRLLDWLIRALWWGAPL